ncbi:MAG: YfhO family protein [Anaerovoracaceae bacterium]
MITLQEGKGFFSRNKYILLSFFLPIIILTYAFSIAGIYPFGENQIAVIDMWHQYFPFLVELQEKLQTGDSLFYTWNGGLGTNFITLIAYYAASPLNLLTLLFPQEYLMEAMTLIVVLKAGFAGAFMCVYLRGMFNKQTMATVAFATLYGLCAYVLGYYWCLMWLDVVALLPLCILGLNKFIDNGKYKMYVITLAIILITNFYIGAMVCIFILIYFPILYFSREEARGLGGCGILIAKAIGLSFLAIAISAIVLVPTYMGMQNTYYMDSQPPDATIFYNSILDVLTNTLPGVPITFREGLPNIYCGLICVMLLVFYLGCKKISLRKKVLNVGLLGFLVLSFNWNKLDFIWHGFHFPNQIPYRYSFIFSFIMVILAYEAFLQIKEITKLQLVGILAGGTAYVIIAQKLYEDTFDQIFPYVCLFFLFLYGAIIALYRKGILTESILCLLILVAVSGELISQAAVAVTDVSNTNRDEYKADEKALKSLIKDTKAKDPDFYRMELSTEYTLNSPSLYTYPGVSQFSSTVNGNVSYLMEKIGLEGSPDKNRYNYVLTTPVASAMLNVKYIMGKGIPIEKEDSLTLAGGKYSSTIYRNKYDLSVGYMVDNEISKWKYKDTNPFNVLNSFVKTSTGTDKDVFHMINNGTAKGENLTIGGFQDGHLSCSGAESGVSPWVGLEYTATKTEQVYIFLEGDSVESVSASRESGETLFPEEGCGSVISLGKCKAGEKIYIDVTFEEEQANDLVAYAYGMDTPAWDKAYKLLDDETLQMTDYDSHNIEGNIKVKEDGHFVTSIPAEKGWRVEVDGQKISTQTLGKAFIAFPLEAGKHQIVMSYMPSGFIAGIVITLCGIGIFIALMFVPKKRKKRDKSLQDHPPGKL